MNDTNNSKNVDDMKLNSAKTGNVQADVDTNDNTKMSAARRAVLADNMQHDLENAGFERLDSNLIELRPPMIKFGELYKKFNDPEKIEYCEKLASTMNHAAYKIQGERNELGELCELKEKQITKLSADMRANNGMVQSQIMKMNEDRQSFNSHVSDLNKIIKDLKEELRELKEFKDK